MIEQVAKKNVDELGLAVQTKKPKSLKEPREQLPKKIYDAVMNRAVFGATVVAAIMSYLLHWNYLGLQLTISTWLLVGMFWLVKSKAGVKNSFADLLSILALVLSVGFMIRDSDFLTALNFCMVVFGMTVAHMRYVEREPLRLVHYIAGTIAYPFVSLQNTEVLSSAQTLIQKYVKQRSGGGKWAPVIRGAMIASPLLLLFTALFASADAVFGSAVGNLFSFNVPGLGTLFGRSILFGIILLMLSAYLGNMFGNKRHPLIDIDDSVSKTYPVEVATVLVLVNILFGVFIVIQAVYLFGGRDFVIDDSGLSFAEYGRRGFFELLAVSGLVFVLVYAVRWFYDAVKSKLPTALALLLIGQVGVVMLSALRRLGLYEQEFGFTELRFYSHAFIFFLAAAFLLTAAVLWQRRPDWQLLKGLVVLAFVAVGMLNIVNPDGWIAQANINRFAEVDKLDTEYILNLSNDALEQKLEATQLTDKSHLLNVIYCGDLHRNDRIDGDHSALERLSYYNRASADYADRFADTDCSSVEAQYGESDTY